MPLLSERSAQSGAVFRLMVDAIIGLVILMMIISALNYFNGLRIEVSKAEFAALIKSAVSAPNGKVVPSGSLIFSQGEMYDATTLSAMTGYSATAFTFQTNLGSAEIGSGNHITFTQPVECKVYARCIATGAKCTEGDTECSEIECLVSFGKAIQAE
jgi:hypothetical protein